MLRVITLLIGLIIAKQSIAGMSGEYEIANVYVRERVVDIHLTTNYNDVTVCNKRNAFRINAEQFPNTDAMVSTALAAHISKRKIRAYIGSCDASGYPIVYAIQVE